jgi:hypothetical protein
MPDVTKTQLVALVQAVIAVAAAFGLPISDAQSAALIGLAAAGLVVLPIADAMIRRGRARIFADANLYGPPQPPVAPAREPVGEQRARIEAEAAAEAEAHAANGPTLPPGEYPPVPPAEPEPPQFGR